MNIEEGIDGEGIVEDYELETFYAALEYIKEADGYLRIVGDDGPGFTEIRVPFDALNKIGWFKNEGISSLTRLPDDLPTVINLSDIDPSEGITDMRDLFPAVKEAGEG